MNTVLNKRMKNILNTPNILYNGPTDTSKYTQRASTASKLSEGLVWGNFCGKSAPKGTLETYPLIITHPKPHLTESISAVQQQWHRYMRHFSPRPNGTSHQRDRPPAYLCSPSCRRRRSISGLTRPLVSQWTFPRAVHFHSGFHSSPSTV